MIAVVDACHFIRAAAIVLRQLIHREPTIGIAARLDIEDRARGGPRRSLCRRVFRNRRQSLFLRRPRGAWRRPLPGRRSKRRCNGFGAIKRFRPRALHERLKHQLCGLLAELLALLRRHGRRSIKNAIDHLEGAEHRSGVLGDAGKHLRRDKPVRLLELVRAPLLQFAAA